MCDVISLQQKAALGVPPLFRDCFFFLSSFFLTAFGCHMMLQLHISNGALWWPLGVVEELHRLLKTHWCYFSSSQSVQMSFKTASRELFESVLQKFDVHAIHDCSDYKKSPTTNFADLFNWVVTAAGSRLFLCREQGGTVTTLARRPSQMQLKALCQRKI